MLTERPTQPVQVADDGKTYPPQYMIPCQQFQDAAHGGPGFCGATPTRKYLTGSCCRAHTPAALNGRPEPKPDPALTIEGLRKAAGAEGPMPPPPASASRVNDDRAIASGKRRSSPERYREARARVEASR